MDEKKINNKIGVPVLIVTAFVWGIAFAFQRSGLDNVGPLTFMASRCVLAAIALAIVCIVMYGFKEAFTFNKDTLKGGLICGVVLTVANNLQQIGLVNTSAGKGGFITAMYIIIVPFMVWLIFKRKPEKKIWLGVVLAMVGLFLLCVKENFTITSGDVWVFGCSITFSIHILVTDYFIAKNVEAVKLSMLQFTVCMVLSWVVAFIFEEPSLAGMWDARIAIAYCGVISAGVGYTLQIVGQKYTKPEAATLAMSLESVFAAIGGWMILGETMSVKEIIGAVLMFAAITIVQIKKAE